MNDSVGDGPLLRDVTPRGSFEETVEGQPVGGGGSMVPGDSVRLTSAMMDPWFNLFDLLCELRFDRSTPKEIVYRRSCVNIKAALPVHSSVPHLKNKKQLADRLQDR
jgi:hypothetical protein